MPQERPLGVKELVMFRDWMKRHDLNVHSALLLLYLKEKGQCDVGTAIDGIEIDPVSMSRSINYLCESGLVERSVNDKDRRSYLIALTEEGVRSSSVARDG